MFLAHGSHRNSLAHWTPPSFKDFPAHWGQLTMFPWDRVFPTAMQAPGKPQAVPSVNIPLWEAVGWGMRSEPGPRTQGDSGLALKSFAVGQMPSLPSYIFRDTEINSVFHKVLGKMLQAAPTPVSCRKGTSTPPLLSFPVLWRQQRQPHTSQPHNATVGRTSIRDSRPLLLVKSHSQLEKSLWSKVT